jgi:hypothetical protein
MSKKISRNAGIVTALISVGVAGVCLAQAVNPNDQAAVKAWQAKSNIQEKTTNPNTGWQTVAAIDGGLLMRGVLVPRSAAGSAAVGLRIEFFAPVQGALSELDTFQVDCNGSRLRAYEIATYPLHNLGGAKTGQLVPETSPDGAWAPVASVMDGILEGTVRAACGGGGGGGGASGGTVAAAAPRAAPPPFNLSDQNAGQRWLQQNNIDKTLPASEQIGFLPTGAMFRTRSTDRALQMSAGIPRYTFRQEYYAPKPIAGGKTALSWAGDYDINCRQRIFRIVATREYSAHNLAGDITTNLTANAEFKPVASDPVIANVFDDLCRS